ncbi:zinc-ribbon domain-containing protein [Sulfitobacter albidus]|uniref:Zinc-ribbon domain-containing protein n=1 Tax=Sulfitobacter albidus TaxID=2829501 RepID=A0A975PN32_9RHOB|nr:zinc-ribbon domain-containing protein [Sulfitobacter albidus]QUJ76865.1 zinc-ribbon domain-containing protein [Sulfitobacter albidus]
MRLVCPNCDAQYEVPDEVMPVTGRDVQCSNCGQTWFQHHPDHPSEEEAEESPQDAPADEEVAPPPPPPPPSPREPERKQLDPAVADILRQEAEAEQAARQRAQRGDPLESQPDLGLTPGPEDEGEKRAREARERMARMRGTDPEDTARATAATAASGARRDLLPDIDEINSSLRAGSGGGDADAQPQIEAPTHQRKRRRGFRTGFLTVMLIFIVLATIYILAPRLSAAVPALADPLSRYVQTIDRGRLWLDGQVRGLLQSLDSVAEEAPADAAQPAPPTE